MVKVCDFLYINLKYNLIYISDLYTSFASFDMYSKEVIFTIVCYFK